MPVLETINESSAVSRGDGTRLDIAHRKGVAHNSDAVETALPETKHRIQISFMTIWVSARMETVIDRANSFLAKLKDVPRNLYTIS